MENIKDSLDRFDELTFLEKLALKKELRLDSFIAERREDTLCAIGINLTLLGAYFHSIKKKEYWFFPTNEEDYTTYLEWVFKNKYLDYVPFSTLSRVFFERLEKHNFKEKLLSEQISEYENKVSGKIEGSIHNWFRNKEFYKLGVFLFEEGQNIDYHKFKSLYYKNWGNDATLSISNTFAETLSCFMKGYFECQFYLFLLEQQKRLLKGEDITKPFEEEETKKKEIIEVLLSLTEMWLVEYFETDSIVYYPIIHETVVNHAKIVSEKHQFKVTKKGNKVDFDSLDKYKKSAEQIINGKPKLASNQRIYKFKNLRNVKTYFESKEKKEQAKKVNDFIELHYFDFT